MLTVRQRYRRTDRQTDRQTDGWTDGRLTIAVPLFALRVHRAVKSNKIWCAYLMPNYYGNVCAPEWLWLVYGTISMRLRDVCEATNAIPTAECHVDIMWSGWQNWVKFVWASYMLQLLSLIAVLELWQCLCTWMTVTSLWYNLYAPTWRTDV